MKGRQVGLGFAWLGLALVAFAAVQGFGQSVQAKADKEKPLELQEILLKLTFTSPHQSFL